MPEIDDIGDRAVLKDARILFDVGADPDGEGFHRKTSAEGECRADMRDGMHPSVMTAGDDLREQRLSDEERLQQAS